MYKINVTASFPGAHHLEGYAGACQNLHGHNWKVRVQLVTDTLDALGMAIDFGVVKAHLNEIISKFDHQYLNNLEWFTDNNPTSENIAKVIYQEMSSRMRNAECEMRNVAENSVLHNPNTEHRTPNTEIRVSEIEVWESDATSIIYTEDHPCHSRGGEVR